MTEAVVELATRNALVGTAHLFTALIVTAMLARCDAPPARGRDPAAQPRTACVLRCCSREGGFCVLEPLFKKMSTAVLKIICPWLLLLLLLLPAAQGFGIDVGDAIADGCGLTSSAAADECDKPIRSVWWPLLFLPAAVSGQRLVNGRNLPPPAPSKLGIHARLPRSAACCEKTDVRTLNPT